MIQPNCRDRLTGADFDFIADTLAARAGEKEKAAVRKLLADPSERDLILDNPKLFERVVTFPEKTAPFSEFLFFYILVRHQFLNKELPNPEIADYCASLLVYLMPGKKNPQKYIHLIKQLKDLQQASRRSVFAFHVQLANYALFLSGMFPEYFETPCRVRPSVSYYEIVGRSSFLAASRHEIATVAGFQKILMEMGKTFSSARRGLNGVKHFFNLKNEIWHFLIN